MDEECRRVGERFGPRSFSGVVERRMRAAYRAETAVEAGAQLLSLARELGEDPPRRLPA